MFIAWNRFAIPTVLVTLSVLGSAMGTLLPVMLTKTAQSSMIAPLIYSQLLSATALGYLVSGDWPDLLSFAGFALICVTGLASLAIARR